MGEVNSDNDINVFKDAITDDNVSIQVDAIKRLPFLASAMDIVRTREELIPCLADCIDAMPDESCFNLAEQLERFVPFIGGNDYVGSILNILIKLACEDEVVVRERAVKAMKNICSNLDNEQCEKSFYPLIDQLIGSDWFTMKCSAGCLISICYAKLPPEKQSELRNTFRNLIQDDSPMVRRSAGNNLVDFIPLMDPEEIKSDFIPVFDNLAQDEQDSVRILAVDVGIAISKKLKDFEIYEYLLKTFKLLGVDISWRVRQRVAWKIHEMRSSEHNREEIINLYKSCVRDEEAEVRVFAAKNLYNFVLNLLDSYKSQPQYEELFEKCFEEEITPEIHYMITDLSEDVRVALSSNILSLIMDALENEEFMPFKENMLKNLNSLPMDVDITKSLKSVKNVIKNLLENSQMHWRTRRNLLLAFAHITRNATSEFFDENLKIFYQYLLNDPIFAIRRTTPLILPLLIKQFGMNWAKDSVIPMFVFFSKDHRYLFRYVTLFGVEELIHPTLDQVRDDDDKSEKYLVDLKELILSSEDPKKFVETLVKIVKLNEKLDKEVDGTEILNQSEDDGICCDDNISFYAEDTLDNLKKDQKLTIFSISRDDIGDNTICYLEGVLLILIKEFVKVIKDLVQDPIKNVQNRAKATLRNIKNFTVNIKGEINQPWVDEAIGKLTEEDIRRIEEELNGQLMTSEDKVVENEIIDCDMAEDEGIDEGVGNEEEKLED
ncbi:hypothetical protein BDFB_007906 [Asbolus verrucosus]|uniref:Uncharacterized protein n=1 Tax=Asbolus verrucosus TaxID=1661398 RepID=A0A482VWW0_ASBVE|nr:hypothetical protein BDFB_007906 [Asbolus verrucosus]